MDVRLCVLCDYATVSQDGKLSILGMFDQINPPALPLTLPLMYVVTVFEVSPVEANTTKELRLILAGADGAEVLRVEQSLTVPPAPLPGRPIVLNHVLGLAMPVFSKSGDYAFHVLVGGEEKGRASLLVNKPPGESK